GFFQEVIADFRQQDRAVIVVWIYQELETHPVAADRHEGDRAAGVEDRNGHAARQSLGQRADHFRIDAEKGVAEPEVLALDSRRFAHRAVRAIATDQVAYANPALAGSPLAITEVALLQRYDKAFAVFFIAGE